MNELGNIEVVRVFYGSSLFKTVLYPCSPCLIQLEMRVTVVVLSPVCLDMSR